MAKLNDTPITGQELTEFVRNNSDFAFEMRVLAELVRFGYQCFHSGTYRDPVTEKVRQFDIRAARIEGNNGLFLAVECKNVRPYRPILLSAVRRTATEAFHHQLRNDGQHEHSAAVRVRSSGSVYRIDEMVGKKTDQVGREGASRTLSSNDEATFDKLNQAVNSCRDLIQDAVLQSVPPFVRVIVPMLVIPDGTLWQVDYGADGSVQTNPRQVSRSNLFINTVWRFMNSKYVPAVSVSYHLSHIEFVTLSALQAALESYWEPDGVFSAK